jgi:hypothetical protein
MQELTIEHVSHFAPYQLFEFAPPNGQPYFLELQEEDVDEAILQNRFRIKNLSVPGQAIAEVDFEGLKAMLRAIKTYHPCFTNTWSRLVVS